MTSKNTLPPILLIHGAWHGAWCWDGWVQQLRQAGYPEVIAVELRGHGYKKGSFKRARLDNYVDDVRLVVDKLPQPPILIGHSLGCTIIERLCQQQQFPAVVLLAPIPKPRLFKRIFLWQIVRHPLISLRSLVTRSMQSWVTSRVSPRLFFGRKTPLAQARAYVNRMQGESFRLFMLDLLRHRPARPLNSPALLIAAEADRFFPVKAQRATAQQLGASFAIAPESGHDIMLDVSADAAAQQAIRWLQVDNKHNDK